MYIEWKRRGMILGIAAGVYVGYRFLLPVALPFLAAWMFAGWLYPAAAKIEKKIRLKKSIAGTILLALLFGAIGTVCYFAAREIVFQVRTAVSNWPLLLRWADRILDNCCGFLEEMTGVASADSRAYLLAHLSELWEKFSAFEPQAAFQLFSLAKGALVLFSGVVVTFICAVLIISDMENLRKKIWDYPWLVGTRRVVRRLKGTTAVYLKAQLIITAMVAAVCAAGLWFLKNPYYLLLGLALGLLDMMPILGTGSFLYPAAVIFLIRGRTALALGYAALDIVTSLLREFAEPRLLGGRLGVSPIAVLASVYTGVFLYGAWGFLLGPLSFSTVYEIGREWDVWG